MLLDFHKNWIKLRSSIGKIFKDYGDEKNE